MYVKVFLLYLLLSKEELEYSSHRSLACNNPLLLTSMILLPLENNLKYYYLWNYKITAKTICNIAFEFVVYFCKTKKTL